MESVYRVEFADLDRDELSRALGAITALGGTVTPLAEIVDIAKEPVPVVTDAPLGRRIFLGMPTLRHIVTREMFNQYGDDTSASWRSRTWQLASRYHTETEPGAIDLRQVQTELQGQADGSRRVWGKTAWTIYGRLINHRLSERGEPIILPWNPEVHPYLSRTNEVGQEARQKLADRQQHAIDNFTVEQAQASLF